MIKGKNVDLRLVRIEDAQFIINLRTSKGTNLSPTNPDLEQQIDWIKSYKKREQDKKEYYFVIESKSKEKLGLVRVYDFKIDSFCWGSWVLKDGALQSAAVESALLVYEFGFYKLKFIKSHFDVRKNNHSVINFHLRFGAKIIEEDDLNYFFSYTINEYEKIKIKYNKFL